MVSIADVNSWDCTKQQTTGRQAKIKHSTIQPPATQIWEERDSIYIKVHHGVLNLKGEEKGDNYHGEPHNRHWKDLLMAHTFVLHSPTETLGKAWRHCKSRACYLPWSLTPREHFRDPIWIQANGNIPSYLNQSENSSYLFCSWCDPDLVQNQFDGAELVFALLLSQARVQDGADKPGKALSI